MATIVKGHFTFRTAAVLFGLSAVLELVALQSETPLFGVVISGTAAAAYHSFYAALFSWLAIGLWRGSRSGYYTLFTATLIYTVDRLQAVFMRDAFGSWARQLVGSEERLQMVPLGYLLQVLTIAMIAMMVSWWGFAVYTYYRREYFGIPR